MDEFSFEVLELDINGVWRMDMNDGVIISIAYNNEPPIVTVGGGLFIDLHVYHKLKMIPCLLNSYNMANIQIHTAGESHLTLFIIKPIRGTFDAY